jgi:hypothetical protein
VAFITGRLKAVPCRGTYENRTSDSSTVNSIESFSVERRRGKVPEKKDQDGIAAVGGQFINDADAQVLVTDPDTHRLPAFQFAPANVPARHSFEVHGGAFP